MANKNNDLLKTVVDQTTQVCSTLYSDLCCTKFIKNLDFQNEDCVKLFLTKSLGYGIIVGASAVKLPQVLKIMGAKSGAGITLFGVLLELMAITFNASYSYRNNFPISAWGEAIFLAVETAMIAFLVLWYENHRTKSIFMMSTYAVVIGLLVHPTLVSREILWWLQSSVLPLAVTGKLIQALKNFRAQHTGQISAISAFAIFAGSVARIFTTIQETGDMLTAVTFACAATANGLLAMQVLWYWKSTQRFIEKGKKKKAN